MTVPNQPSQVDPRRPSVPTSSLPLVGTLPYGHHNRINQQHSQAPRHPYTPVYSTLSPPPSSSSAAHHNYQSIATTTTATTSSASAAGLVTANNNNNRNAQIPPSSIMGARSRPKYSDLTQYATAESISTVASTATATSDAMRASPSSPSSGSYRPLNVVDALAYLDQVKGRFADNPKVYNKFLDIMKDFKSQSIDTPGVIERVSTLFKGHPQLISGFNTFLPAGYRIECSVDPRDPNRIIVTTPNGNKTTSTTSTTEDMLKMEPQPQQHLLHQHEHPYYPSSSSPTYLPPLPPQQTVSTQPMHHKTTSALSPPPPPSFNTGNKLYSPSLAVPSIPHHSQQHIIPPPQPSLAPPYSSSSLPPPIPSSSGRIALSTSPPPHAVDKKPPVEFNHAINYVNRIKNRFASNPDIYKQFLEVLKTYQKEQKPIDEVYDHVHYLFSGADDLLEEFKQFLPEITSSAGTSTHYQQLSPSLYEPHSTNHTGFKRVSSPSSVPASKRKKVYVTKKTKLYQDQQHQQQQQQQQYIQEEEDAGSYSLFDPQRPSVSAEEADLFDRIKMHIGNKPSYEEFLKLLNLYTQEILDIDTLVVQVKSFLGNSNELMDAFKYVIGYEPKAPAIEKPAVSAAKPDLNKCDAVEDSPSYRVVSKEWQNQPCSGRDQMCWEVLNDAYVSHPIWASEDSGFVASKKNQYEEALHRCEEERYEYDLNIEANLNTIALLKPIVERIERMSPEEQRAMRLEPGLGGPTVSIYERIIRKIYDDERGTEIIDMMYQKPATVVPIVLKRLEIKDKEWRRAQRDWNKIWRDIDLKNFYRSLDYQSPVFKVNDRKAMTAKSLVTEIEALKKEHPTELVQFQYEFQDDTLFKDITRLICSFMDKQSGYTPVDKRKVQRFLQSFIPVFFHVKDTLPSGTSIEPEEEEVTAAPASEHEEDGDNTEEKESPAAGSEGSQGKRLKGAYKRNGAPEDVTMEDAEIPVDLFAMAAAATVPEIINQKRVYSFFCSSSYYCLFRLYFTIYERLSKVKSISFVSGTEKKMNKTAVDLDLVPNRFEDIDLSQGYYHALLEMLDQYFEGEIDQATFEENARYLFGIEAYLTFTFDRTIQTLIKQIQTISTDKKSGELFQLFSRDQQSADSPTTRTLSIYRSLVEDILDSDENLYKITFDSDSRMAHIQLLDKENDMALPSTEQESYEDYLASYVDWMHDTEGINKLLLKPSFLQRNLNSSSAQDTQLDIHVKSQLRYKIQPKTYHMYYIIGSEDILHRSGTVSTVRPQVDHRASQWNQWLSSQGNDDLSRETRSLFS
ncbi:paired amphipathic helix protein Sin3a isoform 1 [Mucor ambiguus]|uniref:Paired amphipathic helix protein Sin3a isoform 1 n=1 Tax=Mucor ambiguus TaxID=91626 RepID=A0A0C9MUR1_9FUNG|nr:paired amphipathic helix protein Sin3a isoform 1 [Mucor ambiguus]